MYMGDVFLIPTPSSCLVVGDNLWCPQWQAGYGSISHRRNYPSTTKSLVRNAVLVSGMRLQSSEHSSKLIKPVLWSDSQQAPSHSLCCIQTPHAGFYSCRHWWRSSPEFHSRRTSSLYPRLGIWKANMGSSWGEPNMRLVRMTKGCLGLFSFLF